MTTLDILQKKPQRLETEDEREKRKPAIRDLEAELAKQSLGETVALWLDYPDLYSPAFKDKVAEIRRRYAAGEWADCKKPAEEPKRTAAEQSQPLIAPAPRWEESTDEETNADLYAEGSYLYALYPPLEELQDFPEEIAAIEIAEAIDTFIDFASEEEKRDFFALARERES